MCKAACIQHLASASSLHLQLASSDALTYTIQQVTPAEVVWWLRLHIESDHLIMPAEAV